MLHVQRLAMFSSAIAMIAASAAAAPKPMLTAAPARAAAVQYYRGAGVGVSGITGFWGGGFGFGGGGYNSWPMLPPAHPHQVPASGNYQPAQVQSQPAAPIGPTLVESGAPYGDLPAGFHRTTVRRPIPNAQPNYLATLSAVLGDNVSMRPAGGTFGNIGSGRQLKAGDDIASGPDTEVTLTLRDGSVVRISPATQIGMAPLESDSGAAKPMASLKLGELSAKIEPGATRGYNFGVKTDTAAVTVRSAVFTVRHDKRTGVTTVDVEDGVVQVTPTNRSLAAVSLRTGQQAIIDADHIDAPPASDTAADAVAAAEVPSASDANIIPVSVENPPASAKDEAAPRNPADLTGDWVTKDGSVVRLTQDGNKVSWTYRGPAGHESRTGAVSGMFDGKFLVGTFAYKEGEIVGNGTLTLTVEGESRLVGGWVSTSQPGATGHEILTRQ